MTHSTKILAIDPSAASFADLAPAAEILLGGGLVAGPTQSFYALMALADKPEALARLAELKSGRTADQAFLLLIDQKARALSYAREVGEVADKLMAAFWPGPLTLLMSGHNGLHPLLLGKAKTVGLRMEGLETIRRLIRMVDRGVTGTSANPHGGEPPTAIEEVLDHFDGRIDLAIDAGPAKGGRLSTIVDVSGPEMWVFREGAIGTEELREVCPSIMA